MTEVDIAVGDEVDQRRPGGDVLGQLGRIDLVRVSLGRVVQSK
jgi:hypothetical protein